MTARLVPLLSLAVLALSGCSAFSDSATGPDTDDGLQVAAGFYPLQYVAERVVGDQGEVTTLTGPGQEPHHAELGIQETNQVAEADLVLYAETVQPAVDAAVAEVATGRTMDATEAVDLLSYGEDAGDSDHQHGDDEHGDHEDGDHGQEGDADAGHEHEHSPDSGEPDPHFWHDPRRVARVGNHLAEQLAELDPDNASTYRANARELRTDLTELDEEFRTGLARCERSTVVVSHDAFRYLGEYGLEFAAVAGLSPDQEPAPAELAALGRLVEEKGLTTVFYERLTSPRVVETLADDLGVDTAVLDPVSGRTEETRGQDYPALMRQNLHALREANACS